MELIYFLLFCIVVGIVGIAWCVQEMKKNNIITQ